MSNDRSTSPISVPSSSARQRRPSLSSGFFTDYLSRSSNPGAPPGGHTSPMASTVNNVQPNQRRRLSISTLGLSGSPTQTAPFGVRNPRHGSLSSSVGSSPNADEAAMDDTDNGSSSVPPSSPFARRLSFGAQAMRDVRGGSIGNGRYPSPGSSVAGGRRSTTTTSPASANNPHALVVASTNKSFPQKDMSNKSWRPLGEGFNWSEALRTRAERAPSIGGISPVAGQSQQHVAPAEHQRYHQRAASIASMEQPAREIPRQPKQNKPDFFQEKILRGDFMD
ncbi:hypothetical protein CNMCM8980_003166 [Aspergillus fumigatiaffinis]|jgi:hypothetical protein|uniref:Uncharacterized protein n=1 Tax=Aspergillus fumigatiaffinis TaxID=340414 RepID=A0A8H4EEK0_9EURO|nr:hypothetical protein CNMCM5878_003469 [Aspergillus fumigatiaffinis]KAF4219171.1 hypothetical protein CNMCM6457_003211 [Aspergillus fumigatiaffinis]KAF4227471.1 hypothetical protein CNMCM6805_002884 [Aspergillus fumigatiaffinis]KAF4235906.1 hypothetical protein CNMCM8980_003166 [Aspergillus fumigatiaffinis]